jgi:hypothetical protein
MKNRTALFGFLVASLMLSTTVMAAGWTGYNDKARIFVGTTMQWCMQKFIWDQPTCTTWLDANGYGLYIKDKITMKWNAEWDRGNTEGWNQPPYGAWENNEWNGMCDGCSGEVWHYMIKWVEPCIEGEKFLDGGYCIWGQFEVLMDQGTAYGAHTWLAHAIPTGYGA